MNLATEVDGFTRNAFVKIRSHGSDSEILVEMIKRKLIVAPKDISEVEVDDNLKASWRLRKVHVPSRLELCPRTEHANAEEQPRATAR
jgi:hypothetical protein